MGLVPDDQIRVNMGSAIGKPGTARRAYLHARDAQLIIKECTGPSTYSNWAEWIIWTQAHDTPEIAPLLGSCHEMAYSGQLLVMERLDDLTTAEQKAKRRYPEWMTDLKTDTFGVNAAGEVKIRDYGLVVLGATLAHGKIYNMPTDHDLEGWVSLMSAVNDVISSST